MRRCQAIIVHSHAAMVPRARSTPHSAHAPRSWGHRIDYISRMRPRARGGTHHQYGSKSVFTERRFFFNHVAASNPTPLRVPALLAVTTPLSAVRIPPGRPAAAPTLRVSPAMMSTSSHGTCHGGCGVASDCVTASVIGGGETIARGSATCRHACAGRSMIAQAHKPPIIAVSVAGGGSGP